MIFILRLFYICTLPMVLLSKDVSTSSVANSTLDTTSTSSHHPSLSDKLLDESNVNPSSTINEYGEFQLIQSNVLHVKTNIPRTKRDSTLPRQNATILLASDNDDDDDETSRFREDKKYKHGDKKKKKKKKGLYSLLKKMKKEIPKFMKKMMPMMKMPGMFMLGMAQANLHNFVMHALMMSKMALGSVIMMIIRELVFGDKDEPVKYYNFGYDAPPRRRIITTIEHPVWKRRRRRHT